MRIAAAALLVLLAILVILSTIVVPRALHLSVRDLPATVRVALYYSRQINRVIAENDLDLPPSYFKALIILESGGHREPKHRFEPRVYEKLCRVRAGTLPKFEHITPRTIHDASDAALKNLASSWGPLQIMGYHCVEIDVLVKDLRDADALRWGIVWIDRTYGDVLREGRYHDAFHIHNAGRPVPSDGDFLTTHPEYVPRGMRYMRAFGTLERLSSRF